MKWLAAGTLVSLLSITHAQRDQIVQWDDVQVSNEDGCGQFVFSGVDIYQGIFVSSEFGQLPILNTTVTDACTPYNANDTTVFSPFGFATSKPNVAAVNGLPLDLQIVDANNFNLVGSASFSIGAQLDESELHNSNLTVQVGTLATDFNIVNQESTFTFTPATDGPGPYKIEIDNLEPYILFEVTADLLNGRSLVRHLTFFTDDVVLEIEPTA
ncbi:hypothetical protein F5884DRAFT_859130 [Xylogone sp. PMI_703]|nr:hypothetical protein F5884DRAFT_859130 [Xylogone sp. PMI_703]